jgi:hypothetical protein
MKESAELIKNKHFLHNAAVNAEIVNRIIIFFLKNKK